MSFWRLVLVSSCLSIPLACGQTSGGSDNDQDGATSDDASTADADGAATGGSTALGGGSSTGGNASGDDGVGLGGSAPTCTDSVACTTHTGSDEFCIGKAPSRCKAEGGCRKLVSEAKCPGDWTCGVTDGNAECKSPLTGCGNGVVEDYEDCDDKNYVDGDGCTDCYFDDFFNCNTANPTVCVGPTDLGLLSDSSAEFVYEYDSTVTDKYFLRVTFDTNVLVVGSAVAGAGSAGDIDIYFYDSSGTTVQSGNTGGDETFNDFVFAAGTYDVEIDAFAGSLNGFTLSLDPGPLP
jgi:cysteine-rich repeat protein